MISAMKDAVSSRAAHSFINNQISRYGTVQDLKIDSRQKTVTLSCLLHGEPTPITIRADNYVIEAKGDKKYIHVTRFTCSRPWLQSLLTDFASGRKVELPPWAAAAL